VRGILLSASLLASYPGCRRPTARDPSPPPQASTAARPALACGEVIRGSEAVIAPGSVTLLGEIHGTVEAPAVVARLLCHAAIAGDTKGVVLALEISRTDQPALDAALEASDPGTARDNLLGSTHFERPWKDGRNSAAMATLVEQARLIRSAGIPITIVAFDAAIDSDTRGGARDAEMSVPIAAAIDAHPGATIFVLTGNAHASVERRTQNGQAIPMGAHLIERHPSVHALDIRHAGGTAWTCGGTPGQTIEEAIATCGAHPIGGIELGPTAFVELRDRVEAGYQGRWYVGRVTASPPAIR
jgi:hypothetical protein